MEKIQKALEKARLQRAEVFATGGAAERAVGPTPAQPGAGAAATAAATVRAPITYKQTRVAQAKPDVLQEKRIVAGLSQSALADTFRLLRTQVLQRLNATRARTLAITSPNPGEGKSLTAINLAISLALEVNHTVLLVDLDLRRPSIHTFFNLRPERSLTDYLLDNVPLADCLVNPGVERLVILPASQTLPNSSKILSSPRMVGLAQELKTRYPDRLVLYDLPPVLSTDDPLVFMQYVDACLLVVEDGSTRRGDLQRSIDLLANRNLIGTVLNKSTQANSSYYYY